MRTQRILLAYFAIAACGCGLGAGPADDDASGEQKPNLAIRSSGVTIDPSGTSYVSDFELRGRARLREIAGDATRFRELLTASFGPSYDQTKAELYRGRMLAGDWSWVPTTYLVGPEVLGNALGAFSSTAERVYMRSDVAETHIALFIFLEEIGHFLDSKLNALDSPGDEGELFRRKVFGEELGQCPSRC